MQIAKAWAAAFLGENISTFMSNKRDKTDENVSNATVENLK